MAAPQADLERPTPTIAWKELELAIDSLAYVLREGAFEERWLDQLEDAVEHLDAVMDTHQRLSEEPGGHFDDIAERHFALEPRIEEQRCDHRDIRKRARRLLSVIEKGRAFETYDSDRLCLEARILHDLAKLHVILENELLQEAYLVVEGGEEGRG